MQMIHMKCQDLFSMKNKNLEWHLFNCTKTMHVFFWWGGGGGGEGGGGGRGGAHFFLSVIEQVLLMSTHNICFRGEIRKMKNITWYPLFSRLMETINTLKEELQQGICLRTDSRKPTWGGGLNQF